MSIKSKLDNLKSTIPSEVSLVVVSKMQDNQRILEAYNAGHRIFGENKAQELIAKQPDLPDDIEWHFIGHLQRNKVKYIAPFVKLIHSVDSLRLLKEVNKHALKNERIIDYLLEFHIAEEESKFGLSYDDAVGIIQNPDFSTLKNVNICGVMGMATFTEDHTQIRHEFQKLKKIFNVLKAQFFSEKQDFKTLSMGMSKDYSLAIEEGSNMVRIGSAVFA